MKVLYQIWFSNKFLNKFFRIWYLNLVVFGFHFYTSNCKLSSVWIHLTLRWGWYNSSDMEEHHWVFNSSIIHSHSEWISPLSFDVSQHLVIKKPIDFKYERKLRLQGEVQQLHLNITYSQKDIYFMELSIHERILLCLNSMKWRKTKETDRKIII